jgi:Fe-S-cluster containining protein
VGNLRWDDDGDEVDGNDRLAALEHTRRVLAKAAALYAPFSCPATAECCLLATTSRPPWVWPTEWALVLEALAAQKRTVPGPRADGACRLLGDDGRCTIYGARPFGCRTFFCHRRTGPKDEPTAAVHALDDELMKLNVALDPSAKPVPLEARLEEGRSR